MATGSLDLREMVQELADRAEIADVISRNWSYADEKRFDELGVGLTDDVVALMRNGELRFEGLEEMKQRGHDALDRFSGVQHMLTNFLIDLDGDTAQVRANLVATHVYADEPSATWVVKGVYRFKAVRTAQGWKLSETAMQRVCEEDTSESPAGL